MEVLQRVSEEDPKSFDQVEAVAAEKNSSNTCRVGGDTRLRVGTPLTSCMKQKIEAEDEKDTKIS